jgi:hypothetical protein
MKVNEESKELRQKMTRVTLAVLTLSSSILLCGAPRAQSAPAQERQATIVRPRMLVGERDPLTGFQILRARHDAGARPPDDMAGWALTYLLKGDESFARRAVEEMRRTRTPERVGSRTYPEFVKWSLAFDWLYNYTGFDAALKDRVAGELVKAAGQMLQDQSLRDPRLSMYHNYTVRYLTLARFALTAVEGHPSVEAEAAPLRERARRAWEHILDLTDFITPDGGYHESMDYQRITYAPMALLAELDRTAANSDPALRFSVFRNYTTTHLYKALPDGTTSRLGDNEFPYMRSQDNVVLGYAVHRFKDPYAAWMLRESGWADTKDWLIPVAKFLWDDPAVSPRDPARTSETELSRQHHFRGAGHLVMRDGFGKDSTWIEFVAGPYLAKHQHLDQLHFAVYHKGYLATESGADYTDTESPHYLNYSAAPSRTTRCSSTTRASVSSGRRTSGPRPTTAGSAWTPRATGTRRAAARTSRTRATCGRWRGWTRSATSRAPTITRAPTPHGLTARRRSNSSRANWSTHLRTTSSSSSTACARPTRPLRRRGCCTASLSRRSARRRRDEASATAARPTETPKGSRTKTAAARCACTRCSRASAS